MQMPYTPCSLLHCTVNESSMSFSLGLNAGFYMLWPWAASMGWRTCSPHMSHASPCRYMQFSSLRGLPTRHRGQTSWIHSTCSFSSLPLVTEPCRGSFQWRKGVSGHSRAALEQTSWHSGLLNWLLQLQSLNFLTQPCPYSFQQSVQLMRDSKQQGMAFQLDL